MNVEAFATRIYPRGFKPADFAAIAHDIVIVSPVRPPAMVCGIHVSEKAREIPGTMAMAHRVEAVGELSPGGPQVRPGDVVLVRLSHLDPLDKDGNLCAIEARHIYALLGDSEG